MDQSISTVSIVLAGFAVWLSIINLAIILIDRAPRVGISIADEEYESDDEEGIPTSSGRRIWIDIVNKGSRRILIQAVFVEWRRPHRWWIRPARELCPNLHIDAGPKSPQPSRFWIEPWDSIPMSTDADKLEAWLSRRCKPRRILVSVGVRDALGKWYRSNTLALNLRLDT
jgi:hypothetical protein